MVTKVMNKMRWLMGLGFVACGLLAHAEVAFEQLDPLEGDELQRMLAGAVGADRGRILVVLGQNYLEKSIDQAVEYYGRADEMLAADDLEGRAILTSGRCLADMLKGDMQAALPLCQQSVALAQESGSMMAMMRAYNAIANLHYQSGQLESADDYFNQALEAVKASDNPMLIAAQFNNSGLMAQAQGRYKESMKFFRDGLDVLSDAVDAPIYFPLTFNLGVSYADLGQHDVARDLYAPVRDWARDKGLLRKELVVIVYSALSDIELGEAAKAEQSLLAALARPELADNKGYLAFVYSALGHAYFTQEKYDEALASYEQGLHLAEVDPNTFEQRRLEIGYAQVLAQLGRIEEATQRLETVLTRLEAEGSKHFQRSALETMLKITRQAGDVEASLTVYEKLMEVQEQVELYELEQELALARAAYEVDRKERELIVAERENIVRNGAIMLLLAFGVIGYLYITRRVEMQRRQEQDQLAKQLEDEVEARTRELRKRIAETEVAEQARRAMEKQLSEADKLRVLGQLTGGVAHDFNNLLTVVIGAAELLKVGVDEIKQADLLQHIITAAGSGADITRALMAYARKQPLQLETIELGAFLEERIPLISRTMGGTVTLSLDLGDCGKVFVHIDPAQLTAALLNLALNARDAQDNKGNIGITLGQPRSGFAAISVLDSGVGMSSQELNHAIEPFYTTKEDNQGNGLGLSMVYGFSKQSGGDLEIRSEKNQGTIVSLLLPLHTQGASDDGRTAAIDAIDAIDAKESKEAKEVRAIDNHAPTLVSDAVAEVDELRKREG